jgi:FtsZ-binding cell division protein ZapB
MDEFLLELDEDVEGMQSTIYLLQQQLKEAKEQVAQLQQENQQLRSNQNQAAAKPAAASSSNAPHPTDSSQPSHNPDKTRTSGGTTSSSTPTENTYENRTLSSQDYAVVSNYNSHDHSPPHSHNHPQTTNGDHHVAMETDTSDGQPESCDEDHHTNSRYASNQTSSSKGLNSHASSGNHSMSDGAYATENTDATSSDGGWSPRRSPAAKDKAGDIEPMEDDQSSEVSTEQERTDKKHRTEGLLSDNLLQNGVIASPQSDTAGEDDTT